MLKMKLLRIAENEDGVFGVLLNNGTPFAVTLERNWLDNAVGKSCIPTGNYLCKRVISPKFGNTFEIKDVPNRTHILFHKGNLDDDSHGCVLIGEQFGVLGGCAGILSSKAGYDEFKKILEDKDEFKITITNIIST